MRINIYSQELTEEIGLVQKTAETGEVYAAVRFFLQSPPCLHNRPDDDDRSAVTFWIPNNDTFNADTLAVMFRRAAEICETIAAMSDHRGC